MGDRLFDLGNLAVNCQLDEAAELRLLSAYWDEPPSSERRAALRVMRLMSDAREGAWGAVQAVVSTLDYDFHVYATRHFDRLLAVRHHVPEVADGDQLADLERVALLDQELEHDLQRRALALEHAVYCVGCCWGLMLVLVAAGAMAISWVLLIAAIVFVEKIFPRGEWSAAVAGAALVGLGVAVAVHPDLAMMLHPAPMSM